MDTPNKPKSPTEVTPSPWSNMQKKDWLEESLEDHLRCILCGTDLRFDHKTDFVAQTVVEEAHCPNCRVRNRTSAHGLQ